MLYAIDSNFIWHTGHPVDKGMNYLLSVKITDGL